MTTIDLRTDRARVVRWPAAGPLPPGLSERMGTEPGLHLLAGGPKDGAFAAAVAAGQAMTDLGLDVAVLTDDRRRWRGVPASTDPADPAVRRAEGLVIDAVTNSALARAAVERARDVPVWATVPVGQARRAATHIGALVSPGTIGPPVTVDTVAELHMMPTRTMAGWSPVAAVWIDPDGDGALVPTTTLEMAAGALVSQGAIDPTTAARYVTGNHDVVKGTVRVADQAARLLGPWAAAEHRDPPVRAAATRLPGLPAELLAQLRQDHSAMVREAAKAASVAAKKAAAAAAARRSTVGSPA